MSIGSRRTSVVAGLVLALAGCSDGDEVRAAESGAPSKAATNEERQIDVCSLLTPAEIAAVTGAKIAEIMPDTHGAVGTCNYQVKSQLLPVVSLLLAPSMPKVSTSTEMAAWRSKQGMSFGDIKITITPIEGLGVPAIRNEVEGMGMVTVEAAVKGMLLDVTTASLEYSKALVVKAMKRL